MLFKNTPIRRKLMTVILLTSGAVLLLTCLAFFVYEFLTFRQTTVRHLSTLGKIIAANSTAALAFDDQNDANEILAALQAERHIVAAGLYDEEGNLFSHYPTDLSVHAFPSTPEREGYRFEDSYLTGFQPVVQGDKHLGTLYLKSDMGAMYERFQLYSSIAVLVIVVACLLAYLLSQTLQRQISRPILALAETARAVADRKDYSVRATKVDEDELGLLTDAFNHMLMQIQEQNQALRESHVRVRAVIDSALSAVVVIDSQGRINDWNPRAEKMFGWPRDEVLGRELAETIIPLRYREAHRQGLKHYLVTGEGSVLNQLIELSALHRNGSEFPVELSISPLKTGNLTAFCGFITDITERKLAEEEIRLFSQKLEQKVRERTNELEIVNKELEAFSYSVSHDLRAPLRAIQGYMNILSEDYANHLDDEARRTMNIISNNAKKMGRLIDGLLAFSRLGRKELTKMNISMKEMVVSVWKELKKMEDNRHIEFILKELPETHADVVTIKQVWTNLVSNAIKYTRQKEKAVIEIGSEKKENGIIYYVRDNGAGFDMLYYDKLFDVFQRLHSESEFEGTGIGLAMVQRIIAKHGGRIWADAKPNEGATFYFSLTESSQ